MIRWIWVIIIASASFAGDIKICVSLTVENDEAAIAKCLNSTRQLADCILIYDVGSTDRTIEIVKEFLAESQIPAIIQNHNSNTDPEISAMEWASKAIQYAHLMSEDTYILSLEPNMVLKVGPSFCKNSLIENVYLLLEETASFSSYRPHLFRSQNFSDQAKNAKIKSLIIKNEKDPAQMVDKYSIALQNDPDNEHILFEMALSRHALNQYKKAIECYLKVIEKNSDPEEVWFSRLMAGECYENLDDWDNALYWYLESFQAKPDRSDPLLKISTHYRLKGWNWIAYLFARFGSRLPIPDDQFFFNAHPVQNYQFDEELSIVSFYTQFRDDGYIAASDLLLKRNVPYGIRQQTGRNLLFYLEPLKDAIYLPVEFERPLLKGEMRWNPMNPSIWKTKDGYEVICRTVNYVQKEAREFHTYDENGIFRSRNFLLQFDCDFRLLSQQEITEDQPRPKFGNSLVQGLEDCRLFEWQNNLWFTCTTTDTNPTGSFQISLCQIAKEPTKNFSWVDFLLPLKGPDPCRCEKNWLPFVQDENLYFIYSFDPLVIYETNLYSGDCKTVRHIQPEYDFSSFRGSAGPIPFLEGFLVLIHEVVYFPESSRNYMHRFLFLDKEFRVSKASKPFIFKHKGVEFCSSMCWDHLNKKIILGVGIEDREAWFCLLDANDIRSLLRPLPEIRQ